MLLHVRRSRRSAPSALFLQVAAENDRECKETNSKVSKTNSQIGKLGQNSKLGYSCARLMTGSASSIHALCVYMYVTTCVCVFTRAYYHSTQHSIWPQS